MNKKTLPLRKQSFENCSDFPEAQKWPGKNQISTLFSWKKFQSSTFAGSTASEMCFPDKVKLLSNMYV